MAEVLARLQPVFWPPEGRAPARSFGGISGRPVVGGRKFSGFGPNPKEVALTGIRRLGI
jgi:hypothetical protein